MKKKDNEKSGRNLNFLIPLVMIIGSFIGIFMKPELVSTFEKIIFLSVFVLFFCC